MRRSIIFFLMLNISIVELSKASQIESIKISGYIIPPAFANALEEGMSIPVFLQLSDNKEADNKGSKIADATIIIDQGKIKLSHFSLIDSINGPKLNSSLTDKLGNQHDIFFNEENSITIDSNAVLKFNILSFDLSLYVDKSAIVPQKQIRKSVLGNSSVREFTAVANYDLGVFHSQVKNAISSSSSYFSLDSLLAFAEDHFNLNASAYSIGKSNSNFELYRAMYERDYNGLHFAFGLMDTWNLQSIASLTALSSSKIYALSVGNNSSSFVNNSQQSLNPIYVFLNSPGEIRIYRQGKLLNIQNYPMGNFEIDTSMLPYGIYDVTIETIIDGEVVKTQDQTINKSFGAITGEYNKLNWELYGGYADFDKRTYERKNTEQSIAPSKSYLAGVSIAYNYPILSGISFKASNYGFDKFLVQEIGINASLNNYVSLSWQKMLENHGSHRDIATVSISLPDGYGSLWASKEKTNIKGELPLHNADNYSYGSTLNLDKIITRGGSFTISNTIDRYAGSDSINYEYANTLFSSSYGSVGLRAGVQRYYYRDQISTNEKFINIDFSLPISAWLSSGISSSNGNIKSNVYANKNFEDSAIKNIGISISKLIRSKNNGDSDFSALGYTSYESKYNSGTLILNRPDNNRINSNFTSKGSLAYTDGVISPSGQQGKSGVIINSDIKGDGSMLAKVNGLNYAINDVNTFIPLSPYSDYEIQLMNNGKSQDSFDIISGRNKSLTLYPGNIALFKPKIRQLVTVFGRLKSSDGKYIKYTQVQNHIGRTRTDENGEFSMDVDIRYPVISSILEDKKTVCEADLNLQDARGALWMGEITCIPQLTYSKR
ncbi:TPA: TcfC E-set like domain-containing protein [Providencia alcalifaciens]